MSYNQIAAQGMTAAFDRDRAEGLRNTLAPPPKQPSVTVSAEKLHAGLERVEQAVAQLESRLGPLLLCVPERGTKENNERSGIALLDILDDAVRRAYALAQRIDDIGQRTAI
jgi:hypothetical protein